MVYAYLYDKLNSVRNSHNGCSILESSLWNNLCVVTHHSHTAFYSGTLEAETIR